MVDVSSDNVYLNMVKFDGSNKIEIVYTRSYSDYFRSFLFSVLRVLIIILVVFLLLYNFPININYLFGS